MIDVIEYGNFQSKGVESKKKQIILTHTSRKIDNYLMCLKYRKNGKYDKIPNYLIDREGKIIRLIDDLEYTNHFTDKNINKSSIVICLENLGWLERQSLKKNHINWLGDIYNGEVVEKKWRERYFWHPYTDNQLNKTADLCKHLTKKLSINKDCIGHNTKVNGAEKYSGILTRSNFDSDFTDISPAFNFERFIKHLEDE